MLAQLLPSRTNLQGPILRDGPWPSPYSQVLLQVQRFIRNSKEMLGVLRTRSKHCILHSPVNSDETSLHPASQVLKIPLESHPSFCPYFGGSSPLGIWPSHCTGGLWTAGADVSCLGCFSAGCTVALTVPSSSSMGASFVFKVRGLQKYTETGEGGGSTQSFCDVVKHRQHLVLILKTSHN